jgi:aminoglycoside phosphotransferase (APT) family kinase protein
VLCLPVSVPQNRRLRLAGDAANVVRVELIGRGRTADVYAVGDGTVLRRYRDGQDAEREAATMRHLHGHGFPVPRVVDADGPSLVMERLDGPTLLSTLLSGEAALEQGAAVLAALHRDLRRVPLPDPAPGGPGEDLSVVHLDLHPGNVVVVPGRGPVLLDWANAEVAPGDLDVAMTAVIVAQVALAPAGSPLADPAGHLRPELESFLRTFLREVRGDPLAQLSAAALLRAKDPALSPAEKRGVTEAAELVAGQIDPTS